MIDVETLVPANNVTLAEEPKAYVGNLEQHIEDLTTVIEGSEHPLSISINGEWGAGKTTLLEKWRKQKQGKCIYIDAFASDYIDNPLAVILSEFTEYFKDEKLFKKLRSVEIDYENLAKNGFAEAVKLLTANLIDLNQSVKKPVLDKTIGDLVVIRDAVQTFKDTVGEITKEQEKLYVFIDELDRCKPTYAAEFIEVVKHFFRIENTVFIFAINRKELTSSIKHVQGCDDADRYLKKFFDLNYDLPAISSKEFVEHLIAEAKYGIESEFCDEEFIETFSMMSNSFALTPRDQSQCFQLIMIALKRSAMAEGCDFTYAVIYMAMLKISHDREDNSYYKYLIKRNTKDGSLTLHGLSRVRDVEGKYFRIWLEFILAHNKPSMILQHKTGELFKAH